MDPPSTETKSPPAPMGRLPTISVAGHELTLFVESSPMIAAMAADIRAARERVWLESYIFAADTAGRDIASVLGQQAQAGRDVRLLYDAIGSQGTPGGFFGALAAAGVRVHAYHSLLYALSRLSSFFDVLNRRNHRKLLVVDDRVAYFGGMNIVDTCDAETAVEQGEGSVAGGWRDVHVRIAGPQVPELADSFDRSWRRALHEPVDRRPRMYRRAQLPRAEEFIRFFDSGPGPYYSRAERVYTRVIRQTRRAVLVSMAYFLPTRRVLRAMLKARRRRASIRVVVPGKSDVALVERATRFLYARLLKRGIEVFERERQMLHSKVMVVDSEWTIVGSANLDPRSLEINLEFLAVIRSRPLGALVARICEEEIAHSRRVTPEDTDRRGLWQRFLDRLAYLLRWWL
ncbi:MAG: phosphatidylserine/phosphatidylglycerophosphate/cardiolipin synthase family protein [Planctomycetia bacterium]|nr:phosphatidylserine/phosphatidylglycerophosphate/cardiolipin synthase family protein [Planctomycetia bacterium]